MKLQLSSRRHETAGYALLIVLLFTTVSLTILASTMNRGNSTAVLNERNNQYTIGIAAAEAATEKVIARIIVDYRNGADNAVVNNLTSYRATVPTTSENAYWANFAFSDAKGNNNATFVQLMSVETNAALDFQFEGLKGYVSNYRIISNVRKTNGRFNFTNGVQQDVQTAEIPLFQFAIFYNSLLEFTTAATMTVNNGPVHANGDMYVGSSSPLTFNSDITVTGSIVKPSTWAGQSAGSGAISYNKSVKTNDTTLTLPIGTNNSASAVREVINPPPSAELVTSAIGQQRFYNKAQMVVLVSNTTVKAFLRVGINDTTTTNLNWTNISSFITTNASFTDQRESKVIKATQIDIGKYNIWAKSNLVTKSEYGTDPSGNGKAPNILYVADFRTTNSSTLTAIRLTNGAALPTNNLGLTVATPNPLYVWGHYNASDLTAGSTNTTGTMPASLLADAITILSPSWTDASSSGSFTSRNAVNTTVNAAMVAGVVYSTGSAIDQFSGGVHNYPRLLEDWTSDTLTLNTSLINLFDSVWAKGAFIYPGQPGSYYKPPTRAFSFDTNFADPAKQPPGTPKLRALIRSNWSTPKAGTTNYVGL